MQPDSIIPNPANPQAFNRFSYVYNRPTIFTDPSGHDPWWCEGNDYCMYMWLEDHTTTGGDAYFAEYEVTVDEKMTKREKHDIMAAIFAVGDKFAKERGKGESAAEAFTTVYDPVTFVKTDEFEYTDKNGKKHIYDTGCKTEGNIITCADFTYPIPQSSVNNIVHELGHVFDPSANVPQVFIDNRSSILHGDDSTGLWNQNPTPNSSETFGDFFLAWMFGVWGSKADDIWRENPGVGSAKDWMTTNMGEWLGP